MTKQIVSEDLWYFPRERISLGGAGMSNLQYKLFDSDEFKVEIEELRIIEEERQRRIEEERQRLESFTIYTPLPLSYSPPNISSGSYDG